MDAVPDWFVSYDKDKSKKETVEKIKTELRQKAKREEKLKRLREYGQRSNWKAKRKVQSTFSMCVYTTILGCVYIPPY